MTRGLRAAGIGAVLAAGFAVALCVARPVPLIALRAVGIQGGLDLRGGLAMTYVLAPGTDERVITALRERLARTYPTAVMTARGDGVIAIEVPGVGKDEVTRMAGILAAGGLEFHVVVNDAPVMKQVYAKVVGDPDAPGLGIQASPDAWMPDSGERQTDYYLFGPDPAVLRDYVARSGIAIPAELELVFEHVTATHTAGDDHDYWRSYLVERASALDGTAIADAITSYDQYTGRPIVLLDFDERGARVFGELTARIAGRKLATMLGGVVASAPIINGPIRGGRASITMGGSVASEQEREARALSEVLRFGGLPPGGEVRDVHYVAPTVGSRVWLARALVGAAAGLVVLVIGWVLGRRATIVPAAYGGAASRPGPALALIVTVLAPVFVLLAQHMLIPGISLDLEGALRDEGTRMTGLSPFAFGLAPLLGAFVVVELVALAVPSWRRARLTPAGRTRLGMAVIVIAIAVALVAGWQLGRGLQAPTWWGENGLLSGSGTKAVALVAISCGAATAVLALAATVISAYGLANGFATLIAATGIVDLADGAFGDFAPRKAVVVTGLLMVALVGAITAWWVRRRFAPSSSAASSENDRVDGAEAPAPAAGIVPLVWVTAVWAAIAVAHAAHVDLPNGVQTLLESGATRYQLARIAIPLVLAVGLGWLVAAPRRRAALLARMTSSTIAPDPRGARWAVACGTTVVIAFVAIGLATHGVLDGEIWRLPVIAVMATVVVDSVGEWRARRRAELVAVWPIHDTGLADAAAAVLARSGIAAHLRGRSTRMLFGVFGPFAPIEVLVPPDRAGEASALLKDMFDPAARGVTTAW